MRNSGDRVSSAKASVLLPTVASLRTNEVIMMLQETNVVTGDLRGEHRYQLITVVRDGKLCEFTRDMGHVSNFEGIEDLIIIPDGIEDTVDMIMYEADRIREGNQVGSMLSELAESSTLVEDAVQQAEEKRKRLLNQSQFSNADGKMTQRTGTHPKK